MQGSCKCRDDAPLLVGARRPRRFYPESTIPGDIATEAERVAFLQGVAQASAAAAGPGSARAMLRRTSLCLDACREKMHRALGAVLGRVRQCSCRLIHACGCDFMRPHAQPLCGARSC
jgi:hypothetical protein